MAPEAGVDQTPAVRGDLAARAGTLKTWLTRSECDARSGCTSWANT